MKTSFKIMSLSVASTALLLAGCGEGQPNEGPETIPKEPPAESAGHAGHSHGAHVHGPRGGEVLEVGDHVLHLEVLHDAAAGKLTVYVLDAALKAEAELAEAPVAQIRVAGEPQAIPLTGSGSTWSVTHEVFKGRPEGRLAVKTGGKSYSVEINYGH